MEENKSATASEQARPTIPPNGDCGLFIGVQNYNEYARSIGQPAIKSTLPGSINDAKSFWRVARTMGMRPENMRVLTSPKLDPADLGTDAGPENVGEATREGIEEGARWLAGRLKANGAITGLLTYSGHGAYLEEEGLVVCPTDTRATADGGLENVLPYSTLGALLGPAEGRLTTVLDCCHSGAADYEEPTPSIGKVPVPHSITMNDISLPGRVLAASGPHGVTQQALFMGQFHGAFSWAVTSVLSQWKTVPDAEGRRSTLAYGELIDRATQLVRSLSLRCAPEVQGPENVRQLAVMQRGDEPADTSVAPDGWRRDLQLDPGELSYRWYTIHDSYNNVVANVLVPRVDVTIHDTRYLAGTEYWFNVVTSLSAASIHFHWLDYSTSSTPPTLGTQKFTMPRMRQWTQGQPPSSATNYVNNYQGITLQWGLTYSSGTWGGTLTWYAATQQQQNTVFGDPTAQNSVFNRSTAPNVYWSYTVVPPQ